MQKPIEIGWRNVTPSPAVSALIRAEAARLERASDRIVGCSVKLEAPSSHHRHSGSQFRVRVEVSVPRGRIVVGRNPPQGDAHADLYAVVKQAFREARRQLEDRVRRLDGRVKVHAPTAEEAVVARLIPGEDYGFLRTADGREVYFHANAVLRGLFSRLRVGRPVRFVEAHGDEGPQASTVDPLPTRRRAASAG